MSKKSSPAKRMNSGPRFDAVIVGGGLVGLSLAIALARSEMRVCVIEKDEPASQILPEFDGRVSALSLGSERILRAIGVWDRLVDYAEPIYDIRVADGDSTAHVHYNYRDVGEAPMGHMVENRHIRMALQARACELDGIEIIAPARVESHVRDVHGITVTLADGRALKASLLVAADGKFSRLREECGIRTLHTAYKQTAIVCTIQHTLPHEGLALERFLPVGPFAALPMQGNRSALVWSESEDRAPAMLALDDDAFIREIRSRLGDYLGDFTVIGKRFSYPLALTLATRYTDTRFALIGDSAHAIHPIAGQGVNVGFRDVAVMAELAEDAVKLGLDIGSDTLLEHYQRWRRFDSMTMGAVTDGITRLFSNDITPVRLARDAGLATVNRIPVLKRFFMQHAMGLLGDLPRMMQA